MMSRKKAKPTHQVVIENLAIGSEANEPSKEVYREKARNDTVVRCELSYIGQKAAQISGKVASLMIDEAAGSDILSIVQNLELARFSVRKLVDFAGLSLPEIQIVSESQIKDIKVEGPRGVILLQLVLLPLVAYPIKGAYNIYFGVKQALSEYLKKHPIQFDAQVRYTLVYQRVTSGKVRLGIGCCDNDNFEMQRVTNAITEIIGIADSADKFSFFYTTVSGRSAKTRVFLVRESDLPVLLNDNQFKMPEKD